MTTTTYNIDGMTCGHCVMSVQEAIGDLDGVTAVQVDLQARQAVVTSHGALDVDTVRSAVEYAGYRLAS